MSYATIESKVPEYVEELIRECEDSGESLAKRLMEEWKQTTNKVNFEQFTLYTELVREEMVRELMPAIQDWFLDPFDLDKTNELLDAIADSKVVLDGLAWSLGVDPELIKKRIDVSNATKLPEIRGAEPEKREDGKVIKPAHFQRPKLSDISGDIHGRIVGANK